MPGIDHLRIQGFKSIRDARVDLRPLNVLIGPNGSGKSNFVAAFRLVEQLVGGRLQVFVAKHGVDQLLHRGRRVTSDINLEIFFGQSFYQCRLLPAVRGETLVFAGETAGPAHGAEMIGGTLWLAEGGTLESRLRREADSGALQHVVGAWKALRACRVYHFHDTGETAAIKHNGPLGDNEFLRADGANLAAFLRRLRETAALHYRQIVDTIRLVAPFFRDFVLRPWPDNPDKIRLEWNEEDTDAYFDAHSLSDGTLRFMCLATLLQQPDATLPGTIIIDEPELGLHPSAIVVLAEMLRSVATRTQVVVATQSVTLVNQFEPADVLVVEREAGASLFRRLDRESMSAWLDEYGVGDLWEKNVIGGRPR